MLSLSCRTLLLVCCLSSTVTSAEPVIEVRFTKEIRSQPFTGRVYLFATDDRYAGGEPRQGPNWFYPAPFFAMDVTDWKPETPLVFDDARVGSLRCPRTFAWSSLHGRKVQAVARFNPWERKIGTGPGNGFSMLSEFPSADATEPLKLTIQQLVPPTDFPETPWTVPCLVRSAALSKFHQREVSVKAAVALPPSYFNEPERRYPVVFEIPGFGGTHLHGVRMAPREGVEGVEFLHVMLDPSCSWGHHVFADSANNGPWGTALVTEWLPEFERRFRTTAAPHGRLLTGHSSGGWSSLWLQVTHPDVFGGVWSTAPDPVDFRDFSRVDIYRKDENLYIDPQGKRRPIARRGVDEVRIWLDDFDHMETVLGHGGQLMSFEAVFGRKGANGQPQPLWNRTTGAIDPAAAEAWKDYDIRLVLEKTWPERGPKLTGKLRIFMGDQDTFYLEGATRLLGDSLKQLGSDAVVEMVPGRDHGSLLSPELRQRIRSEMAACWKKGEGR